MRWGILKCCWVGLFWILQLIADAAPCNKQIKHFEILEDKDFTLQQVIQASDYTAVEAVQLGYTPTPYWVRFVLPERCRQKDYVVLDYWGLDFLDIYLVKNGRAIDSLHTGYMRPLATREKQIPQFVKSLPANFNAGDTVYIRMEKYEGTLLADVFLQDGEALNKETSKQQMIMLFFLGVCFIMIVLSLSYYFYFRLNMFLWYAAFLFIFIFNKVVNFGYGSLYLWGDNKWLNIYGRSIWMGPAFIFFLLFAHQLLKVKEFSPKWINKTHKFLIWLMILEWPLSISPLPPYPWRIALYVILNLSLPIVAVVYFIAAIKAIRNKHLPGYFFLACELILLVATSVLALRNFGVIPIAWVPSEMHIFMFLLLLPVGLFSLISYTKTMHVVKVKEEVLVPYKPDPKPLNEDETRKAEEAYKLVEKLFKDEKPYLDPDLTLDTLADKINLHSHLISRAINTFAEKHFFDYVNFYRIEEAKTLLLDEEAQKVYTIEGIATMCGFKNKTSFNKAFKKFTEQTPSSFRNGQA